MIPPCWLGPGAAVEPGALIGPHTVLEQNSWVGRRSLVQRSVLLPGARAEERTTLYGAILCKGAAARPEAVLNEGTVLGERALAEEKAVLLEGVRLWPARVAPAGTRLSRSITSSGRREPLLFGDGGVIRGVLGEDLGPEALMTIGGVLGCEGKVGLGYWGGNGARMLAQAAASGIAAAGGTPLAHDLECAAQAAWLAEHHQIPVSLFLEQEGDRHLSPSLRPQRPASGPGQGAEAGTRRSPGVAPRSRRCRSARLVRVLAAVMTTPPTRPPQPSPPVSPMALHHRGRPRIRSR